MEEKRYKGRAMNTNGREIRAEGTLQEISNWADNVIRSGDGGVFAVLIERIDDDKDKSSKARTQTQVLCDVEACYYHEDGICTSYAINLYDNECDTFQRAGDRCSGEKRFRTKVSCDADTCEYCKDGICTSEKIAMADFKCDEFVKHTDISPEYNHVFYKRVRNIDGRTRKAKSYGKRYKMQGFVWYTDQDDRNGIDDISFTEEKSGLGINGRDITAEKAPIIQKAIDAAAPVLSLPDIERQTV